MILIGMDRQLIRADDRQMVCGLRDSDWSVRWSVDFPLLVFRVAHVGWVRVGLLCGCGWKRKGVWVSSYERVCGGSYQVVCGSHEASLWVGSGGLRVGSGDLRVGSGGLWVGVRWSVIWVASGGSHAVPTDTVGRDMVSSWTAPGRVWSPVIRVRWSGSGLQNRVSRVTGSRVTGRSRLSGHHGWRSWQAVTHRSRPHTPYIPSYWKNWFRTPIKCSVATPNSVLVL